MNEMEWNGMTMCLFSTIERPSSHYVLYKLTDDPSPHPKNHLMKRHLQMPARNNAPSAQEGEPMQSIPLSVVKGLLFMMQSIIKRH